MERLDEPESVQSCYHNIGYQNRCASTPSMKPISDSVQKSKKHGHDRPNSFPPRIVFLCCLFMCFGFMASFLSQYMVMDLSTLTTLISSINLKKNKLFANRKTALSRSLISLVNENMDLHQRKNFNVAILPKREIMERGFEQVTPLAHPEAKSALRLAVQMRAEGKKEKALKLLKQCKSLSPHHPDILNEYGEFLEEEEDDIIEAEHHYALALVFNPDHSKAIKNRIRTLPLVKELDMAMLKRIENKRDALTKIPEGNILLQRAKMEAYYQHIYHSNAIEGNTMTLSMTRAIVETGIAIGGKSILEHNEVLGLDTALKYINNTLLNKKSVAIGIEDITEIHRRVLGFVNPVEAGQFRASQVFVGDHIPPAPTDVENLMEDFDDWLCSRDALMLHPIELASLSHYKLVYIHPFSDGNGRTARLLMNLFLMQAGYPPVIIKKEQRFQYYEYLRQANLGDVRPFIRFVAHCTENTLDEYLSAVTIYPNVRKGLTQDRKKNIHKKKSIPDDNGECSNLFCVNKHRVRIGNKCSKND